MNLFDLIFGTERKKVAELESLLNKSQDELTKLDGQNLDYARQVQDMRNTITAQNKEIADLMNENSELKSQLEDDNVQLQILKDHQKQIDAANPITTEELERVTERMQEIINGSLHVDFIWRDKGYLIQIHPDAKVDGNYSVLRDRVIEEMKGAKYTEYQEINNRTFFVKTVKP